jgi:hypothetical protein
LAVDNNPHREANHIGRGENNSHAILRIGGAQT